MALIGTKKSMVKRSGVKYSPVESDRAMAERGGVKHSPLESGRAMVECSGVRQIPLEAAVEWDTECCIDSSSTT